MDRHFVKESIVRQMYSLNNPKPFFQNYLLTVLISFYLVYFKV